MTHPLPLSPATHDDGLGSGFPGHRGDMGVLGELLSLRQQLTAIAASRAVATAHRLTADVASILEPVWTVLPASDSPSGVGYLRGLGYADAGPEVEAVNGAVAHKSKLRHPSRCQVVRDYLD